MPEPEPVPVRCATLSRSGARCRGRRRSRGHATPRITAGSIGAPAGAVWLLSPGSRSGPRPTRPVLARLNATLIPKLSGLAADHLAHCRARHRQRPNDLLDRQMPLEKRPPYLANLVHADHPLEPFPADTGQRKGTLTKRQRGRDWTRKAPLRGSLLRASSHFLIAAQRATISFPLSAAICRTVMSIQRSLK